MSESTWIQLENPEILSAFRHLPEVPEGTLHQRIDAWPGLSFGEPDVGGVLRKRVAFLRMAWLWITSQFRSDLQVLGEYLDLRRESGGSEELSDVWCDLGWSLLSCDEARFIDILESLDEFVPLASTDPSFLSCLVAHFRESGHFRDPSQMEVALRKRGILASPPPTDIGHTSSDVEALAPPLLSRPLVGPNASQAITDKVTEALEHLLGGSVTRYDPEYLINEIVRRAPQDVRSFLQGEKAKDTLLAGAMQSHNLLIAKRVAQSRFHHYPCPIPSPTTLKRELGTNPWYILHKKDKPSFPESETLTRRHHRHRLPVPMG